MRLWFFLIASVLTAPFITVSSSEAQTISCDTDCNDRCKIGSTPWGDIIEPLCKSDCEIKKVVACEARVPVPTPIPPAPGPAACGQIFENTTGSAVAACSNWDGRLDDQHIIQNAVQALIARGFLSPADFAGVEMRWCPHFVGEGIAPRQNRIYLHADKKQLPFPKLANLLAHEIFHITQYRRMGGSNFACTYSQQFVACGGCQDERHPLEKEAYDFGDRVEAAFLANPSVPLPAPPVPSPYPSPVPPRGPSWVPPPPVPRVASQCVVGYGPNDWCRLGQPVAIGGGCWCPTPWGGFLTGIAR
jgi:hypothetical protein